MSPRPTEVFTSGLSAHRVTSKTAGYHYGAKLGIAPAGLSPASTAASLAARSPRFLGDPYLHAPLLDPGGPLTPGPFGVSHAAFRKLNDVGSAPISLSRLYHAAYRSPVYASQAGSPPHHATLGSGWWPTFAGSGLSPAGSQRRFPPCLSVYMTSSITKLCLAQ